MSEPLEFRAGDRVLVLAPHPDDETLGAGLLIQAALAAGATLRVVFATDGDDNPWPQRWLERRWRIDTAARARWGRRRRAEAQQALAALGVNADAAVRFLGWPDQGVTELLMSSDEAPQILAAELESFAPSHVVLPALGDLHPDHGALHVLLEIAVQRSGCSARRLAYLVHGVRAGKPLLLAGDAVRRARKLAALGMHRSQLALSRGRLQRLARTTSEAFDERAPPPLSVAPSGTGLRWCMAHRPGPFRLRRHELLLIGASGSGLLRLRVDLPRCPRVGVRLQGAVADLRWSACAEAASWRIELADSGGPLACAWAKISRRGRRLLVFDREPWRRLATAAQGARENPGDAEKWTS